jgi:site-specific DNA-cytosine methylase
MVSGPPSDWVELLKTKEILGATSADLTGFFKGRANLLIGECESCDSNLWNAVQYVPAGMPSGAAIHDVLTWDDMKPLGPITLKWDKPRDELMPHQLFWCFDILTADVTEDSWDFCCDKETVIIPFHQKKHDHFRMLSLYGGGYGGWSYAMSHLAGFHMVEATTVMIDSSMEACVNYCLNHGVPLINGYYDLPADLMTRMSTGCAIHGNATSDTWIKAMADWHANLITISSPCPPWSGAAKARGLNCAEGMLLPETMFQCRILQPSMVGIEQVGGFQSHQHKHHVLKTFYMTGFNVVWSRVVDLATFGPVKRSRWLALLRLANPNAPCDAIPFRLPDLPEHTPKSFEAVLPFAQGIHWRLRPTPEMLKVAQNEAYLPPTKRCKVTPKEVIGMRTYTQDQQIPVIMASYGSQHLFSHEMMLEKGCLTHFFDDPNHGIRLFHPCELAMIHGATSHVFALHDFIMSWRHMGNQIAVWHAMLVLLRACKMTHFAKHVQPEEVYRTWDNQRLNKNSNTIFDQGSAGFHLRHMGFPFEFHAGHHDNIRDFLQKYGKGIMPENHWWDVHGLHDITHAFPLAPYAETGVVMSPATTQPDASATEAFEASATQPFKITVQASVSAGDWNFPFWIASDVTPHDLNMLWNRDFESSTMDNVLCLRATAKATPVSLEHKLLAAFVDGRMTVYTCDSQDVGAFCSTTMGEGPWFDQFGKLMPGKCYHQGIAITDQPQTHRKVATDLTILLAAFKNCVIVYKYFLDQDAWCVEITGDSAARQVVAKTISEAISKETLGLLGRTVSIVHDAHVNMVRVIFRPSCSGTPVPPTMLTMCLAVAMTRSVFDLLQSEDGLSIQLKWQSRILWNGKIDRLVTAEIAQSFLTYTLSPIMQLREVRLIHNGKRFASGSFQLCDLQSDKQHATFYVGFAMCGGAGPAATKTQLKQHVRNAVAAWLLESNIELQWVHENLEKAIDDIGVKTLIPIIQQPSSSKRDSQLKQAFHDASVTLPDVPKQAISIQSMRQKTRKKQVIMPEPMDYKVDCTYLLKQDDTQMNQINDFRANISGVYLTNGTGATPWLRENQTISPDELGLLVIGALPIVTTLPTTQIAMPCFNAQQQQVLLQVTLVQFGSKLIKVKEWDQTAMQSAKSKVCSLTMWKQDWTAEEWANAIQHTAVFLKEVFASEKLEHAVDSTWGRSLRNGRQPATHRDATSVQVHAAIREDCFLPFLKATGYNKIWAAPKGEDGRIIDEYRVLWLPANYDHQRASTVTAKLSGVAGLVRGRSSMGVRICTGYFDTAWKVLYPQTPAPADVSNKLVFKAEPLPFGCNIDMLLEWGKHIGWKMRPLRAIGPKSWLLCSGDEPPIGPVSFNGHPVLLRKMPPRSATKDHTILAGPRAKPSTNHAKTNTNATSSHQPQDPWWNYLQQQGQVTQQVPAAPVQGPTEQRLAQQDAKMAEMESKIEAIHNAQTQQNGQISQIQTELAQTIPMP